MIALGNQVVLSVCLQGITYTSPHSIHHIALNLYRGRVPPLGNGFEGDISYVSLLYLARLQTQCYIDRRVLIDVSRWKIEVTDMVRLSSPTKLVCSLPRK